MDAHARVVVIGGGIAGCSTLYHLTVAGWTDVVLLERDELTSGTTWHSAAQVTNFGAVQTMVGLKTHSIRLYNELGADPDYPINYHERSGGIRLGSHDWHMDGYRHFVSMAKGMGVDFEVIDAVECARRHPLIETHELLGGLWDPLDGDIDPAQLCQALARRARRAGAKVHRFTPVTGLARSASGEWRVSTPNGTITCEHVVNAGGYRVNEVAAMMGTAHPVVSMEHQYFVTESIPDLEARDTRVPLLRDPLDDFYSRQEKQGLLVGIYEQDCRPWGLGGIDPDFTNALCPNDLDRCLHNMERVFARLPALREVGIRAIVNGPITYSADGLPLVGEVPGVRNAWCIVGLRAGVGEGGGHGKILADLIVHGESEWDTWCLDPRRFGPHADEPFTVAKAVEDYRNEFRFHRPHEHRPAGRPARVSPLYARLHERGARFVVINGWERASFFAPDADFEETHGFGSESWHDVVAGEVAAVTNAVGLCEVSGFNRIEVRGPAALEWLDELSASRMPAANGRVRLAYFLNRQGHIVSEATLARLDDDRLWFGSAAAADVHDFDWLSKVLPEQGVELESLTDSHSLQVVAGPKARELMAAVAPGIDWSRESFAYGRAREVQIGSATVTVFSLSYSGEIAFELHMPNAYAVECYGRLLEAGEPLGLREFGAYAAESMRIEMNYPHWKADIDTEVGPHEAGLTPFVATDKQAFVGRDALIAAQPAKRERVLLAVDAGEAPVFAADSVLVEGRVVGTVTSAAYGHRLRQSLAIAYVDTPLAAAQTQFEIESARGTVAARVTQPRTRAPY